jgi:hypothetical protein
MRPLSVVAVAACAALPAAMGCMTRNAYSDPQQIEAGLRYWRSSPIYTVEPEATVALVVPAEVANAAPEIRGGNNLYVGRAMRVRINPSRVVAASMRAYLDDHAAVEIVPDLASVTAGTDLVLGLKVEAFAWRTNWWRYVFAARIDTKLDLWLRDYTNDGEQLLQSGWVTGGTYWSATPTGVANRVVRGLAHATAKVLHEADVIGRLAGP